MAPPPPPPPPPPSGRCCSSQRMWAAWLVLVVLCAVASHAASGRSIISGRLDPALDGEDQEKVMAARHEGWMARHGRTYKDEAERRHRLAIFKRNVEHIESFNNKAARPGSLDHYRLGVNKFADLTTEEFRATYLSGLLRARRHIKNVPNSNAAAAPPPPKTAVTVQETTFRGRYAANINITTDQDVPSQKDWRQEGAVTDVKDQKHCGCCWAFSTVAAVEGITQIKAGKLVPLSEQELVDCDDADSGCEGGDIGKAFEFVVKSGGLATEEGYPYRGTDGTCDSKLASASRRSPISSFEGVRENDEQALMRAVAQQPVSVAVDATNLQHYQDGVFTGPCGTELNHAVTVVGYGTTEQGTKYWLVRNSWGKTWGEAGYVKMQRGIEDRQGICGIAMDASYPVV